MKLPFFPRLRVLDGYLARQYFQAFFFIVFLVMTVSVVIDFVERLDEFLEKKPPLREIVLEYYVNFVFYWANTLAPISVFLAVIFITSRLAGRSEFVAMLGSGISFYRIFAPYLVSSLLLAGLMFLLKSYGVPLSTAQRLEFEYKYLRKRRVTSSYHIHKKVAADTYVYMYHFNEKTNEGTAFGMEQLREGDLRVKIQAKKAVWVDSLSRWRLMQVSWREMDGGRESIRFLPQLDTTFLLTPDDIFIKEQKAESMILPDLLEYIRLEEMRGSDILYDLYIERHRRFSDPLAVIILTLIGFSMSSRKLRGGIALQIGIGLLICFFYATLLYAGQIMVGDEYPAWMGVWLPNMIFLPLALILMRLAPK
jgi:lipopolysaccharide export system permease protein